MGSAETLAGGEPFDWVGWAVPGAAAGARQRQWARLRCGSGAHGCECEKLVARRSCRGHNREFSTLLWARAAGALRGLQSRGKELAWEINHRSSDRQRDF